MGMRELIGQIGGQLWAVTEVIPSIFQYKLERSKAQNAAIASMRKALNRTRMFLKKPDYENEKVLTEISDLWNEASEKVGVVDPVLGEILGNKSRFWSDRELFIGMGKEKEIMSLNEVVSEIDRLYIKLK